MKKYLIALVMLVGLYGSVQAQRPALVPPVVRFSDANGKPLVGGKLFSYAAGTTTPLATYSASTTGAVNTNPVILDSTGSATVFLGANVYKLVLQNSAGVTQWTADNIAQGMFASSYVTSFTGNQGTTRSGAVVAITGDYSCAMVSGAVCTLPPAQTLYYQTVKAGGSAAPQEPILNFIAGVAGSVTNPVVTAGGSGYSGAPTVSFSGGTCTVLPTASANVSTGFVTNPVITAGGSGYTSAPTVVFTGGGGTGATATAVLTSGAVTSMTITAAGTGYTSAPSVSFTGGGGTGASATVTIIAAGAVSSVVLTSIGSGCATAPTVTLSGGGGSGATATVSLSPNGISCVDNPGSTSTDCTFTVGSGGGTGGGCTLTDVSGSRTPGGTYQNPTNGLMYVSGALSTAGSSTGLIVVAQGPSSPTQEVYRESSTATVSGGDAGWFAAILPGYFYNVQNSGAVSSTVHKWVEITGCGQSGIAASAITALTGDVTATGPGSVAATLATVNSTTGPFGDSTHIPTITVNGKGLITNAVLANIATYMIGTTALTPNGSNKSLAFMPVDADLPILSSTGLANGAGTKPQLLFSSNLFAWNFLQIIASNGPPQKLLNWFVSSGSPYFAMDATVGFGFQFCHDLSSGSCTDSLVFSKYLSGTVFGTLGPAGASFSVPWTFTNSASFGGAIVTISSGTATNVANFGSEIHQIFGSYWNGTSAASDIWQMNTQLGTGTNPTSVLSFAHTGTPGPSAIALPTSVLSTTTTVSALPTCSSTTKGFSTAVTDASSPTYLGTVTGGSSTYAPVICNGTNWVTY